MEMTKENIDEFRCFVSEDEWKTLSLAEKIEFVALTRMTGEEIDNRLSNDESNLYYRAVELGM